MKSDRRVIKTDQAICQSLMELMMTKPFDKITVSEVAEHANIGRKTFYLHFSSLEEVLTEIEQELTDEARAAIGKISDATPANLLKSLNQLMLKRKAFYQQALNTSPNLFLNDDLQLILERSLQQYYESKASLTDSELSYWTTFLAAGIVQIYRRALQAPEANWHEVNQVLLKIINTVNDKIMGK